MIVVDSTPVPEFMDEIPLSQHIFSVLAGATLTIPLAAKSPEFTTQGT